MAAALLVAKRGARITALVGSGVVFLLAAGPLLTIHWSDNTLPIQSRYGLPLFPILLVGLSWAIRRRGGQVVLGAIAAYAQAYLVYRLVTF